ncbi:SDR family NAD(P)-dependent oxidoreductase, partial [bacterium]|nr:SDR family NAD(P)-dependent oxidoreductase [bacterium]
MKSEKQKQVVLITGCSSGFGLLTSIRLAQRGYEVVATMRNLAKRGVLDEAIERHKLSLTVLQLDVTDIKSIEACLKDISEKYGHLDVLVNNAGYGIGGFFEDLSDKEYRDQLETNFFGVL